MLSVDHLLSIAELKRQDIELILGRAQNFSRADARDLLEVPFLRGQFVANLFFEPSTRTQLSFEVAAKKLNADVISLNMATSSLVKGETLLDTAKNIEAMGPELMVVRSSDAGVPKMLADELKVGIINAGDGQNEHPTQALLDAFTLLEHFGRSVQDGLKGLTVAIVGDIKHSRVANSNMRLLTTLGAKVRVTGPRELLPDDLSGFGVQVVPNLDEPIVDADAVMMLRIQKERFGSQEIPSEREYHKHFGLTLERFLRMPKHAVVMHPGPMNRGVEIQSEVADHPRSLILRQVKNGVAVRMAVLHCLFAKRLGMK
jgi:aspartate carbamoyltransferase catalytic subunit